MKTVLTLRLLVAVELLALTSVTVCGSKNRRASVYNIPNAYRGWVIIEFDVPACPALPVRDGKLVFEIKADGTACTSTHPDYGYAHDEYYFVSSWEWVRISETGEGQGGLIWGGGVAGVGSGPKERTFIHFFVGTEAQLKAAPPWIKVAEALAKPTGKVRRER